MSDYRTTSERLDDYLVTTVAARPRIYAPAPSHQAPLIRSAAQSVGMARYASLVWRWHRRYQRLTRQARSN